jgi:hypothetical protein
VAASIIIISPRAAAAIAVMHKRVLLTVLAAAAALPMAGCVVAEVVAAPVLIPVMVAGDLYSGSRAGRTPDWKTPRRDVLNTPGAYRLSVANQPTAPAQLTINPDRSMTFDGFGCTLAGSARPDLSRQAPGDWKPGQVYQVSSAAGACSAASGALVYVRARLHLAPRVSAQDFPFGNHLDIALWSARCCGMTVMSTTAAPWPDFVRVETSPEAPHRP